MTEEAYTEIVRVALETQGWKTTWSPTRRGPNEAGWFVQYDEFRMRGALRVRVFPPHAKLIIVGDRTGAYVFSYRLLKALKDKQGIPESERTMELPISLCNKFHIFTLKFDANPA